MKRNGFAPLLIILIIATLGVVGYFGYRNYLIKPQNTVISSPAPSAKSDTTSVWKTYKADASYGSISFEYPGTYPVSVDKDAAFFETGGQGIGIYKFDINNFDYSQMPITKTEAQKYYDDIVKGALPDRHTFASWSLDASDQIKKTKSGKYFKVSTTFSAFEACDFKFHTLLEIPQDNNIINVTIYGNIDKIRKSMDNSPLLKLWEGCTAKSFAEGGMGKFWDLLVSGGGTPEARDWFDTANHVINSLDF